MKNDIYIIKRNQLIISRLHMWERFSNLFLGLTIISIMLDQIEYSLFLLILMLLGMRKVKKTVKELK